MTGPEHSYHPAASAAPQPLTPDWSGADGLAALPVNQVLAQVGANAEITGVPDGVYLVLGHAGPPILIGDSEAVRKKIEEMDGKIPVEVHGRYFFTRDRLAEIIAVLQSAAGQFDAAAAAGRGLSSS